MESKLKLSIAIVPMQPDASSEHWSNVRKRKVVESNPGNKSPRRS